MSLRWRILGAFIMVITLATFLSIGVGYFTTQWRLDTFITDISSDEADNLAQNLSQEYTLTGGWETLGKALLEAGYLYDVDIEEEESEESDEGSFEFFHENPVRVVIVDVEGYIVQDNFSELGQRVEAPELDGQRATIFDLDTGQAVGYAHVNVNDEYLAAESNRFLEGMLLTTAIGGLLTSVIALLLAVWLSRRITAPVTALTRATQAIAEHGETTSLPVVTSDELGQMSESFNRMATALQTQRDLRKRLINDVSHELNTPLSVIQLEAKGLRDGLQTPTQAADHIIQEVNMLRNLVRDLNWLAETDSGEVQITVESCSIHQLLTTEVKRWQPQAQAHQIALSLQPLPELPMLNLDSMRMSQVIGIIIHNALQHTEAGGIVTIVVTIETDRSVCISVTDNGFGIDPADLPHIFNRFYRTDQSRSRGIYGTGLGLAIACTIIEAHNGTITAISDGIGQGTTVRFDLPLN